MVLPTLTDGSLGRTKTDEPGKAVRSLDYDVPASEYNAVRQAIIDNATSIAEMTLGNGFQQITADSTIASAHVLASTAIAAAAVSMQLPPAGTGRLVAVHLYEPFGGGYGLRITGDPGAASCTCLTTGDDLLTGYATLPGSNYGDALYAGTPVSSTTAIWLLIGVDDGAGNEVWSILDGHRQDIASLLRSHERGEQNASYILDANAASHTLGADVRTVRCGYSAGNQTLTLGDTSACPVGKLIHIIKEHTGTATVTLAPDTGSSINGGAPNVSMTLPGSSRSGGTTRGDKEWWVLRTGATTWRVIGGAVHYDTSGNVDLGNGTLTTSSSISVGSITVGGNVDGRDVSADGTKLDGIASGRKLVAGGYAASGTLGDEKVWAILPDVAGANMTVTLPAIPTGTEVYARYVTISASAYTVTFARSGGTGSINGVAADKVIGALAATKLYLILSNSSIGGHQIYDLGVQA